MQTSDMQDTDPQVENHYFTSQDGEHAQLGRITYTWEGGVGRRAGISGDICDLPTPFFL